MSFQRRPLGQGAFMLHKNLSSSSEWTCLFCQHMRPFQRFSTSARARQEQYQNKGPFNTRLRTALRKTKIEWKYRIPIGFGIVFLGTAQFYRVQQREKKRQRSQQDALESTEDEKRKPRKRERIRPSGPW